MIKIIVDNNEVCACFGLFDEKNQEHASRCFVKYNHYLLAVISFFSSFVSFEN